MAPKNSDSMAIPTGPTGILQSARPGTKVPGSKKPALRPKGLSNSPGGQMGGKR